MKEQVLFQADCKAKAKINICQNQLQMRLLLIPECHKNLEGLKRTLKRIFKYLWIGFVNLKYFSHISAIFSKQLCVMQLSATRQKSCYFQLSHCQAQSCRKSSGREQLWCCYQPPGHCFPCLDYVAVDFVSASSVSIPTNKIRALLTFF